MRGLEERLGVRLLHRTTRSVTPTEAGQRLLDRLDPALREVADALEDMTALQAEPTGTLRLNVPRPAARLVLAPMLAGFVAKYPRVQVDVVTDDGLADIVGMASMPAVWPEAWWRRLSGRRRSAFACVAAPSYLVLRGTPRTPRELPGHACIGRRFPSGHRYAWEFQVKGEPLAIEVNGLWCSTTTCR